MEEIEFISLIALIQHSEKYHNKRIRLVGPCMLEFEGKSIWVSQTDMEKAVTKNAVWLDCKLDEKTTKLNKKYLVIEGTFDSGRKGHLGMYSGTIKDISRIELWEKK